MKAITEPISVLSSFFDKQTRWIWFGSFHHGIKVYDTRNWKEIKLPALANLPRMPVRSIEQMNASTLLFGLDGAGVYASLRDGKAAWLLFNAEDETNNALHGNGIYCIRTDSFGDIWMGSYSGGIDMAIPIGHIMEIVQHEYLNEQSLVNSCVNSVLEDSEGNVWYATDRGVSVQEKNTGIWHHSLYNKVALTLCQSRGGGVLVGTYGDGVFEVLPNGTAHQAYSVANGKLKTDYVYSLLKDRSGDIWIGCLDGQTVRIGNGTTQYYNVQQVQTIAEMPDGRIAIGTSNGLYAINKNSGNIEPYFTTKDFPKKDINFFIQSVIFTSRDIAWIATDGGGIYVYNKRLKRLRNINVSNGLPSNTVYALGEDRLGRIIASTELGLAFVSSKNMKVVNINFVKGLEREYKRMSIATMRNGNFILGTSSGAVIINPQQIATLAYKTNLRLVRFELHGMKDDKEEQWRTDTYKMMQKGELRLSHDQNTFDFVFESINYKYQHDIAYQYMLEGFDKYWSKPSSSQNAHYTNLPPGNYRFLVRNISRNDGKIISEKSVEVNIAEPWWNTWMAWVVYCALFIALVYLVWQFYYDRLEHRYYDEKIRFFTNTAHDIRTPLSLVLAPLNDIAEDDTLNASTRNYLDIARRNGEKLLKMVTKLLDFQKADRKLSNMNVRQLGLRKLLNEQIDKFSLMASQKNISLTIDECPEEETVWMDADMADKIFENLLSNALKYTKKGGHVNLSAWNDDKNVYIKVKDDGIGIPKKSQKHIFQNFYRADNAVNSKETGSGLGLMLVERLVAQHHGKMTFESEENKGTTFIITLQKGYEHLKDFLDKTNDTVTEKESKKFIVSPQADGNPETTREDKATILFVDDNDELRNYIQLTFCSSYNIQTVESGEAALAFLEQNICDIVVSDVMMPGMNGNELCRIIKEKPETSWLPVILLTAISSRDYVIKGLEEGADDYITKPFDVEILKKKIDSILLNHRRLSKYYLERSLDIARNKLEEPKATEQTGEDDDQKEINECDQKFVDKVTSIVMKNLSSTDFNIDRLCRDMAMSRTLFYGKLKKLTSKSPQDFIRIIRLERSATLIKEGNSVLDVSVMTGFVNVKHFSTTFKKHFGVSPSKYE
jgi:signal transduction histidine kinase/DNA-binding response OmpR family regulator/ligand-binding sensor domain-containing protein